MPFLNLLNRIFGLKNPLTRQEIDAYKNNTSNSQNIEETAEGFSLNKEGLEGWENTDFTVLEGMKNIDTKLDVFYKNQGKIKHLDSRKNIFVILLTAAACFLLIFFTYKGNQMVSEQQQIEYAQKLTPSSSLKHKAEEINTYQTIDTQKQITAQKLTHQKTASISAKKLKNEVTPINSDSALEDKTSVNDNEIKPSSVAKEAIKRKSDVLPILEKSIDAKPMKTTLSYHIAKEIYINQLKNVDYRAYRSRPISYNPDLISGVPANNNGFTKEQKTRTLTYQNTTQEIPYIDYLTTTIVYFKKGNYKIALKRYLVILETYQKDVNANFYGGLCYYNLGQFDNAIQLLKKSYTITYGNFKEEAIWYIAKANFEQNKILKTKYFLKRIIQEDGFYSSKATELLQKIKNQE